MVITMRDPYLMHGGDYNPEQWLAMPEILEQDIDRFLEAGINTVTLGVFSWAKLEPKEGIYDFDWLAERIDKLYEKGISVILATRPAQDRTGWQSGIRRYCGWMRGESGSSLAAGTTTA